MNLDYINNVDHKYYIIMKGELKTLRPEQATDFENAIDALSTVMASMGSGAPKYSKYEGVTYSVLRMNETETYHGPVRFFIQLGDTLYYEVMKTIEEPFIEPASSEIQLVRPQQPRKGGKFKKTSSKRRRTRRK